jgi:PilZ domain
MRSIPTSAPQQGNRYGNRLRLGAPASLVLTHETRPCLIDNIASSGARLRVQKPLTTGLTAILCFHELRLYCSVIWFRGDECGLRFVSRLALEDMQGLLWITQNREQYDHICLQSLAANWFAGIRD